MPTGPADLSSNEVVVITTLGSALLAGGSSVLTNLINTRSSKQQLELQKQQLVDQRASDYRATLGASYLELLNVGRHFDPNLKRSDADRYDDWERSFYSELYRVQLVPVVAVQQQARSLRAVYEALSHHLAEALAQGDAEFSAGCAGAREQWDEALNTFADVAADDIRAHSA